MLARTVASRGAAGVLLAAGWVVGATAGGCVDTGRPTGTASPPVEDAGAGDAWQPECVGNAARCHKNTVQFCQDGVWEDQIVCSATFPCSFGRCGAQSAGCEGHACGQDGQGNSCGTCDAGMVCSQGQCVAETCAPACAGRQCGDDGCGGSCGACGLDETCADGACVTGPSCADLMRCGFTCQDQGGDTNACLAACTADASGPTISRFLAAGGCIDTCDGQSSDPGELADCVMGTCSAELTQCMYPTSGTTSCQTIMYCGFGCSDRPDEAQDACVTACALKGSPAAQELFARFELCVLLRCALEPNADLCVNAAIQGQGPCGKPFTTCRADAGAARR